MPVFLVTTDRRAVPAARFVAADVVELGDQVATYLARHRVLSRAVPFQAEIGDEHGAINQQGLTKPIYFSIVKES